jgi:hypothetical protein
MKRFFAFLEQIPSYAFQIIPECSEQFVPNNRRSLHGALLYRDVGPVHFLEPLPLGLDLRNPT